MVKALVLLATGVEPIEAICPIDFMLRGGIEVVTASVGTPTTYVEAAPLLKITCDVRFEDVKSQLYDVIVVPGGIPGTSNLAENKDVVKFIQDHHKAGKHIASICAAPGMVLAEACQIMKGVTGCGYPGVDDKIDQNGGKKVLDRVHVDGKIITSRGPGTAALFGIEIVRQLVGAEKANEIAQGMLVE